MCFCRPGEIPYGDKDQKGEYTLQQGDVIEFSIATDRRDKLQRATNIVLLDETFEKTTERRETVSVVVFEDTVEPQKFQCKDVNIILPINLNICFGCSKEPSH